MSGNPVDVAKARWREVSIDTGSQPMTRESLTTFLQKARTHVQKSPGRLIPTAFDPNSDLTVYPRDLAWHWKNAADIFARYAGGGVMMRLPLFWQTEMALFDACKSAGTFVFINDRANMPLGAAAIARSSMKLVVTDAEDANAFAQFLMLHGLQFPQAWFVIQHSDAPMELSPALTNSECSIYREIHVLPGMPIATQCEHMVNTGSIFHLEDGFIFELGTNTLVTGGPGDPLPLVRFATGLSMEAGAFCACGKPTVRVEQH